ncbi:MAG: DivIVA domain-containing protein [Actinobacteria bacterium]|nr:DivIVA domain-containing protein [Actinomycetota bacterium]
MSISFSRPDPSSPAAVGAAAFSVGRRGFDQNEVKEFLRMVAAELARLQEREKFLERELRSAQTRAISEPGALTEEMVTELLGEETARIIAAAREAALQIRERAEETAGRLIREASDDASRIRKEADIDSQRMRGDAASDAQAEIEMARQQGTEMVNEARQYRERVLNELAKRRELAREQIEQFEHGRDRLLNSFERARQTTEEVLTELSAGQDEDAELIDLTNATGPIPVIQTAAPTGEIFDVEAEEMAEITPFEAAESAPVAEIAEVADVEVHVVEPDSTEPSNVTSAVFGEVPSAGAASESTSTANADTESDHVAPVVSLFPKSDVRTADVAPTVRPKERKSDGASVDNLFEKLRTSSTEQVVERVKAKPAREDKVAKPKQEDKSAAKTVKSTKPRVVPARKADLTTEIANLAKKLKRVFADEQNGYFEFLRRKGAAKKLDSMLADLEADLDRYRVMLEPELMAAALKGASSVSDASAATLRRDLKSGDVLGEVHTYVGDKVVEPIRKSVQKCLKSVDGDTDQAITALRGVYRQWRSDKADALAEDLCRLAFGRGAQNTAK